MAKYEITSVPVDQEGRPLGGWIADDPAAADSDITAIVDFGNGPQEARLALTTDPSHSLAMGQRPNAPVLTLIP